ncbi:MAG: lycopene cyclase domain-containing protein [Marinoscillum sp.]|uniref:lycopene cyclase domain-containing protein n=1 Tax=Marinoscillum sp. TaxID=2024838 RepID=UPI0032F3A818
MKSLYLLLHIFTIAFPLIRSFEPRIRYAKKWPTLFPAIVITAAFFITWDIIFTQNGVWGFNEKYLVGVFLFGLPLEEWLFFVSVPFASVFIYECVRYFMPQIKTGRNLQVFTVALAILIMVVATLNTQKSYTFWNFTFSGSFLIFIAFLNPGWLGKFWVAYALHLIPFLFINGILTGSFLQEPIVWYNDAENLNIRIFTIPIEDSIYALLLLLMNVTFYEGLNKYYGLRT